MSEKITNKQLLDAIKRMEGEIDELREDQADDLEGIDFSTSEDNKRSMLTIDPATTDSLGDSVELVTNSRLKNNKEAFEMAATFAKREYHSMVGNRFGKHSKLIPVLDANGKKNPINLSWFSGSKIRIVELGGKEYYKIRLLMSDIVLKKILLLRIPTNNGGARQEEIHLRAAETPNHIDPSGTVAPMKPIKYSNKKESDTE